MFKNAILVVLLVYIAYGCCNWPNIKLTKMLRTASLKSFVNEKGNLKMADKMSPHTIKTRQTSEDICISQALQILCERGGHFQQLIDIGVDCGSESEGLQDTAAICSIRSDGQLCVSLTDNGLLNNAGMQCLASGGGGGNNQCPSGCANALRSIRNRAGCCLNLFNDSSNPLYSNSLWSACGVPTVTEECGSTVTVPSEPTEGGESCTTEEEFEQRAIELECSDIFNRVARRISSMPICNTTVNFLLERCLVNSDGDFCARAALVNNGNDQFNPILSNCAMDQTSCSTECAQSLEALRNDLGCCLNSRFNGTDETSQVTAFVTDYSLWDQCDVETPPQMCQSLISGAERSATAMMSAIFVAVFSFFVAMWNI